MHRCSFCGVGTYDTIKVGGAFLPCCPRCRWTWQIARKEPR